LGSVASTKAPAQEDGNVKMCLITDPTCEACQ
jgi:hypothetical protein